MTSGMMITHAIEPAVSSGNRVRGRILVLAVAMSAVGVGAAIGPGAASSTADPDLARLLRFMALLKGAFAVIALGVCFWRLARPAALWREVVYIVGPGLMACGALCLWRLQSAGFAVAGLHIGMFVLLAAALTDGAFIPRRRRRSS